MPLRLCCDDSILEFLQIPVHNLGSVALSDHAPDTTRLKFVKTSYLQPFADAFAAPGRIDREARGLRTPFPDKM